MHGDFGTPLVFQTFAGCTLNCVWTLAPVNASSRFSKPDCDLSVLSLAGGSSWGAHLIFSGYGMCPRQPGRPQRPRESEMSRDINLSKHPVMPSQKGESTDTV